MSTLQVVQSQRPTRVYTKRSYTSPSDSSHLHLRHRSPTHLLTLFPTQTASTHHHIHHLSSPLLFLSLRRLRLLQQLYYANSQVN